jgi:hypothetical protein
MIEVSNQYCNMSVENGMQCCRVCQIGTGFVPIAGIFYSVSMARE